MTAVADLQFSRSKHLGRFKYRRPCITIDVLETTCAILLRRIKLTESSLIVSWLSREHGRLKTVCKGARGAKSPFAGVLDLFFTCEIAYSRSGRSELHTLRDVKLVATHESLRFDYVRLSLAAYFTELLELVTEPEHAEPELYDLLSRALEYLDKNPASKRALLHFENEVARRLGIQEPGIPAANAISRVYHKLPESRAALPPLADR